MRREKVNVAAEFLKERGGAQHKEVLNLVVIGRLCASGSVREFFAGSGSRSRKRPKSIFSNASIHHQLIENRRVLSVYVY
jgi:hypothetical protein